MEITKLFDKLQHVLDSSKHIVVIQADNPDGDSLASALALEELLGNAGKTVSLYCGIDMPENIRYLDGWDRVSQHMPRQFDAVILVDCAFLNLLGILQKRGELAWLKTKPFIVLDHHGTETDIDFATVLISDGSYVATGELIFELAEALNLEITPSAANLLAASILADTLGLSTSNLDGNPKPFYVMAQLVERGASVTDIQDARLERLQYPLSILKYRAELLQRIEFYSDNRIGILTIPYKELNLYSTIYNPTVILDELRNVENVGVAIGFKLYERAGKIIRITGRVRCTRHAAIASALAESFGGGGHPKAAGFKIEGNDLDFNTIKQTCIDKATELLSQQQS